MHFSLVRGLIILQFQVGGSFQFKMRLHFGWCRSFGRFQSTLDLSHCIQPSMNQQ